MSPALIPVLAVALLLSACRPTPPCAPVDLTVGSAGCSDENSDGVCDRYEARSACSGGGCPTRPFGFCAAYVDTTRTAIQGLGASWLRPELWWEQVEPSAGRYDFSGLDKSYDELRAYGLAPLVSLRTRRGWATECDHIRCVRSPCPNPFASCPPQDLTPGLCQTGYSARYYAFVRATLEHLFSTGRPVEGVVVENEVNTRTFWQGTEDDYLKTRATAYKAVKDFDFDRGQRVGVVDNGIASDVWAWAVIGDLLCADPPRPAAAVEFANRFYQRIQDQPLTVETLSAQVNCSAPPSETGPGNNVRQVNALKDTFKVDPDLGVPTFDVLSYHFYGPPETQQEILDWMTAQMRANGYQRPIIVSEGGYDDPSHRSSDGEVADALLKLHVVAFGAGVQKWFWLKVDESDGDGAPDRYRAMYSPANEPLPAASAYRVLVQKLDGFTGVNRLNLGAADVFAYDFTVRSGHVYVLWTGGGSTSVDLSLAGAGPLSLTRVDGTGFSASSSAVPVSASPVYAQAN